MSESSSRSLACGILHRGRAYYGQPADVTTRSVQQFSGQCSSAPRANKMQRDIAGGVIGRGRIDTPARDGNRGVPRHRSGEQPKTTSDLPRGLPGRLHRAQGGHMPERCGAPIPDRIGMNARLVMRFSVTFSVFGANGCRGRRISFAHRGADTAPKIGRR